MLQHGRPCICPCIIKPGRRGYAAGLKAFGFVVPGDRACGGARQERPAADCGGQRRRAAEVQPGEAAAAQASVLRCQGTGYCHSRQRLAGHRWCCSTGPHLACQSSRARPHSERPQKLLCVLQQCLALSVYLGTCHGRSSCGIRTEHQGCPL